MHKFTVLHTIPILSPMLFIPSLYSPFLNFKNFLHWLSYVAHTASCSIVESASWNVQRCAARS